MVPIVCLQCKGIPGSINCLMYPQRPRDDWEQRLAHLRELIMRAQADKEAIERAGKMPKQDEPKDKRSVWVRADDVVLIKLYEEMADKGLYTRKGPSSEAADNLVYEWNGD